MASKKSEGMKRTLATDELQQKCREAEHGQTAIPHLGAVIPAPFPFLLGIELHLGGQLSCRIQTDFRSLKTGLHQIGESLDEGG